MKLVKLTTVLTATAVTTLASDVAFPTCYPCSPFDIKWLEWLTLWIGF